MKKLISLSVFLVFFGINQTELYAQTDVTAEATVVAPLIVAADQPLQFGQVVSGTTKSVNDASNAGRASISGTNGANVIVTLTTIPTTLDDAGGNSFPINNIVASSSDNTTTLGSDFASSGQGATQPVTLASPSYIFFRGDAVPPGGQTPGDYTATITITVDYQ